VRRGAEPVTGTVRRGPVALRVGFAGDLLGYAIDLGLPPPPAPEPAVASMFGRDPEIKREVVWSGPVLRPATTLVERGGHVVLVRDGRRLTDSGRRLDLRDSMLAEVADAVSAPELLVLREQVRSWRFYDSFRTDPAAPARGALPGTFTPVMADDGADLASALQTLRELGYTDDLDAAVDQAFPGSSVDVVDQDGLFRVRLQQSGLLRPLDAAELSDGTLRFLLWAAALLTPRPPALFVLNEPETSLHPDLLEPLAALIVSAATRTQVVVVTHSAALRRAFEVIGSHLDRHDVELAKELGETVIAGQGLLDRPSWHWPSR